MSYERPKASRQEGRVAPRARADPDAGEWGVLREEAVGLARRLGAEHADAEDLAQEAVTRLYSHSLGVVHLRAWLRKVLRNLLYDQRERRAVRARAYVQAQAEKGEERSPSGEWNAAADVEHIFSGLQAGSRRLLDLYCRGHTRGEIAAHLGCQSHQVGPRISRALQTSRRRATGKLRRLPLNE